MSSKEYLLTTNNISIPEMLTLTTGGEEEGQISQAGDNFFTTVRESLENAELDIRDTQLELYHFREDNRDAVIWPSDGYLRLLTVNDEITASVLDRRDGFNFHQVSFAYYPLGVQREISENVEEKCSAYFNNILTDVSFPERAKGFFSRQENYALYPLGMSQGEKVVDEQPGEKIHILEIQDIQVASVIVRKQNGLNRVNTASYLTPKVKGELDRLIPRLGE